MRRMVDRRRFTATVVAALMVTTTVACDKLLDVDNPAAVPIDQLDNPALMQTLEAASIQTVQCAFQQYVADLVRAAGGTETLAAQIAILAEGAQTSAAIAGTPEAAVQVRVPAVRGDRRRVVGRVLGFQQLRQQPPVGVARHRPDQGHGRQLSEQPQRDVPGLLHAHAAGAVPAR